MDNDNTLFESKEAILTDKEIKHRLELPISEWEKKLIILPILDIEKQLGSCSFDVRLGTEFSIPRRIKFPHLDILEKEEILREKVVRYESKIHLDVGEPIIIHPKEFILASTLEFIKMPEDIFGILENRSSWARLGIFIALARFLEPGFIGTPTLEIFNSGTAPITLYPCLRIAQVTFIKMYEAKKKYLQKKYFAALRPEFSKIYYDEELEIFRRLKFSREEKEGFM